MWLNGTMAIKLEACFDQYMHCRVYEANGNIMNWLIV